MELIIHAWLVVKTRAVRFHLPGRVLWQQSFSSARSIDFLSLLNGKIDTRGGLRESRYAYALLFKLVETYRGKYNIFFQVSLQLLRIN